MLYKVRFRCQPVTENMSLIHVVMRATEWLCETDNYQHLVNWYDNRDCVVFVLTDRNTALKLKLSLNL